MAAPTTETQPSQSELGQQVTERVLTWLESGEEFVANQAPLLAEEMIRYGLFVHSMQTVASILVTLVLAWVARYYHRKATAAPDHASDGWDRTDCQIAKGLALFGVLFGVILCVVSATHLAEVTLAPRLYVLSELLDLARGPGREGG